jgi:hypothetical protein
MIPCSRQIGKFQDIIDRKIEQGKKHDHIKIIRVNGIEEAFLFQDMFPIIGKYVDCVYSNATGIFEIKDRNKIELIENNSLKIIDLLHRGIKFTPTQPDINRIEKIMLDEMVYDLKVADLKSLGEKIENGDLAAVHGWLNENIHRHGSVYTPAELIKKVTGKELDARYFIDYLNQKYSGIYKF